jgi:hypothetical protein
VLGAVLEIGLGTAITGSAVRCVEPLPMSWQARLLVRPAMPSMPSRYARGLSGEAFADLMFKAKLAFDDFLFGATQGLSRFKV